MPGASAHSKQTVAMASVELVTTSLDVAIAAMAEDRVGGLPPDGAAFRAAHPMVTIEISNFVTHDPFEDAVCEAMQRRLRDSPDNNPVTSAVLEFARRVGGVHIGFRSFHVLLRAPKHLAALVDIQAPAHTSNTSRAMLLKYVIDYGHADVAEDWVRRGVVTLRPQAGLDLQGFTVAGIPASLLAHAHDHDRDMWVRLCRAAGEDAAVDDPARWLRDAPELSLGDARVLLREVAASTPESLGVGRWSLMLTALDVAAARLDRAVGRQGAIRAWFVCEFFAELSIGQLVVALRGPLSASAAPWSVGIMRENHAVLSALVRAGRLHAACAVACHGPLRRAQLARPFLAGDEQNKGVLDELRAWWDAGAEVKDSMADVPSHMRKAHEWPDTLTPAELVTMLCRACVLVARELCNGELDGIDSDDDDDTVIRVCTTTSTSLRNGIDNVEFSDADKDFLAAHDATPESVPFTIDWFRSKDAQKIRRPQRLRHVEFWRQHVHCVDCLDVHLLHPAVELKLKDIVHLKDMVDWGDTDAKDKADIMHRMIANSQAPLDAATVKSLTVAGVDVFEAVQLRAGRLHARCLALEAQAREASAHAAAADARVDELAARLQRTQDSIAKLVAVLFGDGGDALSIPAGDDALPLVTSS